MDLTLKYLSDFPLNFVNIVILLDLSLIKKKKWITIILNPVSKLNHAYIYIYVYYLIKIKMCFKY